MARRTATLKKTSLAGKYLDTVDRRLARAGIAWRLRREGPRWLQTLKATSSNPLTRFEHEVIRPDATPDASAHAGTAVGEQLAEILRRADADGIGFGVRFETNIRRTARRTRTRGAVVEIAFDEGRLVSGKSTLNVRELEFELISGSPAAMLSLVERWRRRFGLIYDPRGKAERGDQLADGMSFPPVRRSCQPEYGKASSACEAFGVVIDECLTQVTRNAIGLSEGDPGLSAEHVHQMRVGIRRLLSALRSFRGWAPAAPPTLVEGLRTLFTTLGACRDSDVLDSGVLVELTKAGAPTLMGSSTATSPSRLDVIRDDSTQRTFLAWIAWRESLAHGSLGEASHRVVDPTRQHTGVDPGNGDVSGAQSGLIERRAAPDAALPHAHEAPRFRSAAARRLRRWHELIADGCHAFDELDDEHLHKLRKRIKRQRYAAEFFAPMFRRQQLNAYLETLSIVQDRMGELNDLFVARARFQSLVSSDPKAWFAVGWLVARIAATRASAKPELRALAKHGLPTRR